MSRKLLNAHVLLGSLLFLCSAANAQNDATSSPGINDVQIAAPTRTGVLGRVDPKALAEVTAHLAVVGLVPWLQMQGVGQIVYADEKASFPATLSTMGADRFRLDAQTDKGTTSIRIDGLVGKVKDVSGNTTTMPPNAAATGIFPFHIVRIAHFPGKQTSLTDQGTVTVDGNRLHRITVERRTIGRNPATKLPETAAIDLYFDLSTHLLIKSATAEMAGIGHSASFLRVVTYGDYRQVGLSMIPFRYAESMDGEQYQVLQLSDVQLKPTFDATYFQFERGIR